MRNRGIGRDEPTEPTPQDESLVLLKDAQGGDDEALQALLVHYQHYLLRVTRRKLGPKLRECIESADVVQGANMVALRKLGELELRDRKSLLAWLARIVENKIHDEADFHLAQRRDVRRRVSLEPPQRAGSSGSTIGGIDPPANEPPPSQRAESREMEELVERTIARLSPQYQEVLRLRDDEERTFEEIARLMERPTAHAASVLYYRARTSLAEALGPKLQRP